MARELGDRESMPPYIQLGNAIDKKFGGGAAGFLGDQYNPFILPGDASSPGFTVRDVVLPGGVDRSRFAHRMKVLQVVDTWQKRTDDDAGSAPVRAAGTFYEKAYNLVTAPEAKKAFDIHSEDPRLRDRYGRNSLGQGCLLVRRLIEGGVRFVTVTDGGWDTHQDNFKAMKTRLLPRLDAAVSGLVQDLSDRGMLDQTLVVVLSDFGRTPKVNPSAGATTGRRLASRCWRAAASARESPSARPMRSPSSRSRPRITPKTSRPRCTTAWASRSIRFTRLRTVARCR